MSLARTQPLLLESDNRAAGRAAAAAAPAANSRWPHDNSSAALLLCQTVFLEADVAHRASEWFVTGFQGCPAHCLALLQQQRAQVSSSSGPAASVVLGSFPYDGKSSVCLAAIHSGAIDEALGGLVQLASFHPYDWSDSPTQTIFPYDSHRASLSHGVQSLEVPAERRRVPSGLGEMSWTVASRGLVWKRRIAPFSPRSGHAVLYVDVRSTPDDTGRYTAWWGQLVVGGRNATHQMNDVYLYDEFSSVHARWRRLGDAPFTPRSDMIAYVVNDQRERGGQTAFLYFIAGQTEDACGLQELGVCSNEVWAAWLNTNETQDSDELRLHWLSPAGTPHALLPFAARCDAAFDVARRRYADSGCAVNSCGRHRRAAVVQRPDLQLASALLERGLVLASAGH